MLVVHIWGKTMQEHGKIYNQSAFEPTFKFGKESYLYKNWDERYFDLSMGSGVHLWGHTYKPIVDTIKKQANSLLVTQRNDTTYSKVQSILQRELPLKNYIFCNSGAEAVQKAVRIARVASKKLLIASNYKGWHGINDVTLHKGDGLDESNKLLFNSVEELEKVKDDLAAVIIEPIKQTCPTYKSSEVLEVYNFCKDNNILIIFDEIITGFRHELGGVASQQNLNPDLIVYGKALGGGLPVGLVSFSNEVASKTFENRNVYTWAGGTFSCNHLVMSVVLTVLEELKISNYSKLHSLGNHLRAQLKSRNINAVGCGSITRIKSNISSNKLYKKHILLPRNGIIFNCFNQTFNDMEYIAKRIGG